METLPENINISGYKCFKEFVGFNEIKNSNIVVGRNNIGKSSIIEMFEFLKADSIPHDAIIKMDIILQEEDVKNCFRVDTYGGDIPGSNHWQGGGIHVANKRITIQLRNHWKPVFINSESPQVTKLLNTNEGRKLIEQIKNPFKDFKIRRILAERDIVPEPANTGSLFLGSNGDGATNVIQNIINKEELDSSIIQETLLNSFNQIMYPDMKISNIVTQIKNNNTWEIYFDDDINGRVSLSKCGSGLKTVLLVLLNLYAYEQIENDRGSKRIFIFEELENNLHPALQRRLFSFLHNYVTRNGYFAFITTHSNVVIDQYSFYNNASLYSIRKDDERIVMEEVKSIFQKRNVLDELDIRASDLLQTNAIIWVEGPSDRVYINKLLSFYSEGNIQEGIQYQFLYYGGRLLSHYSASEDDISNLLSIIKVNRNSIIVIDSDKKNKQQAINNTKKRIKEEFDNMQLFCWITRGREIENYIPIEALKAYFGNNDIPSFGQFDDFAIYAEKVNAGSGKAFERNKVAFAEKIIQYIEKKDIDNLLDIKSSVVLIQKLILKWNMIGSDLTQIST